jgi:serine/threonine protein kinase/Tfp pilus assembly protein PilF
VADALPAEVVKALADPRKRLGHYVLLAELGRGGMGVVYRAFDTALLRPAAIKMVTGRGLEDREGLERFKLEASSVAQLRHPHIVQIYDVGEHEGHPFIAMELVPGVSFEKLLKTKPPERDVSVAIVRDVARALAHAHEKGIVHRDVKPENVMVDTEGRPKLMDFGLARTTGDHERLTVTGTVLGTPAYMSPEQANADSDNQGPRSDIYAAGAILYRVLAGHPPFVAKSLQGLLKAVLLDPAPPLRKVAPGTPAKLEAIAMRCLEKKPQNRYATAEALADELDAFLKGDNRVSGRRPVSERRRSLGTSSGTVTALPARNNGLLIAMVAGGVVIALLVLLLRGSPPPPAHDDETHSEVVPPPPPPAPAPQKPAPPPPPPKADPAADARAELEKAKKALERKDREEALARVSRAIQLDGKLAAAWALRGDLRLESGDLDGASADCSQALEIEPRLALALRDRGIVRVKRNDFDGALEDLDGALASRSDDAGALAYRGFARSRKGDLDGALDDLGRAIALDSSSPYAWTIRGNLRIAKKDYRGAITDCTRAIELDGAQYPPWRDRSIAKRLSGDKEGARADAEHAVQIRSGDPDLWVVLGTARREAGDLAGARDAFSSALEKDPGCVAAWTERADVKLALSDLEGARDDSDRALSLRPKELKALLHRSVAKRRLGDLDGAIDDANAAVLVDPRSALAYLTRAKARRLPQEASLAKADLEKFLELAPDSHQVEDVKRAIAELSNMR